MHKGKKDEFIERIKIEQNYKIRKKKGNVMETMNEGKEKDG